ncbi:MAG TPA: lysylphosphatidylglycerol synthase transmembrane domain-containing protein [Thermoanaerobaculia bacterium]
MKRILQLAAIVALTVFFLWLFLRNADLATVGRLLKTTNVAWIVVGFVANFGALLFRTVRWRTILDPDSPPPFYATFFANTVGFMLSIVLPIRAADVARPALLSRRTSHRFSGALGTVLTERVLDLSTILLLFVTFALLRWNEFSHDPKVARWFFIVKTGAVVSGILLAALAFLITGLFFFRHVIRKLHEKLGKLLPKRFRDSWMHFFDSFAATTEIARHRTAFVKVLCCTALIWLCLTAQFWFATLAVHHPLPYDSSFFVTGVTTVGLAIPTPGGVGGFHKACQLVLVNFYGFSVDLSVAVAVLFHLIGTAPVLVTGLILFAKEGLRWREVTTPKEEE